MPSGAAEDPGFPVPGQSSRALEVWLSMGQHALRAVLIGLFLGFVLALIGGLSVLSGKTTYSSTAVMLINDPYKLATSGQPDEFGSLDLLRFKYSALMKTQAIAGPVANKLGYPEERVSGALSTEVPASSLLMDVIATWPTRDGAQTLAQAAASEVTAYVNREDDAYRIPQADRFTFEVIDPAPPGTAHEPSKAKAASLAIGLAVLGFAIGFVGTQLIRFLRTH